MTLTEKTTDSSSILGHATGEAQGLQRLGQVQYACTKHLFAQAGIAPGMNVLDVGSGPGDVALLLAELIGPTGSIVGVDVYPTVLETAPTSLPARAVRPRAYQRGAICAV